jgi:hypothetical protein
LEALRRKVEPFRIIHPPPNAFHHARLRHAKTKSYFSLRKPLITDQSEDLRAMRVKGSRLGSLVQKVAKAIIQRHRMTTEKLGSLKRGAPL